MSKATTIAPVIKFHFQCTSRQSAPDPIPLDTLGIRDQGTTQPNVQLDCPHHLPDRRGSTMEHLGVVFVLFHLVLDLSFAD